MIQIAIVEDDKQTRDMIGEYINRYALSSHQNIESEYFTDGDEIVSGYKKEFHIILMDVEMKLVDGITAAKIIRERDPDVVIIFITNMAQYAIQGYEVNALDYILKPVNYFSFAEKLNRAVDSIRKLETSNLVISYDRGLKKINIGNIYYIESQGHKIIFYMKSEQIVVHSVTMKALEEKLTQHNFYRCNKGYLVNLEYVEGIEDNCAIISNERILISRQKRKAFYEALTNYIGDKVN